MPDNGLGKFFKHSAVYAVGNAANRAGSFLLLPLYTHFLSVEQYGSLELFYVVSGVVSSVLSVGLAHAALRFYFEYREPAERNKVISTCLWTTALYSIPAVFLLSRWNATLSVWIFGDVSYAGAFNLVYAILVLELMRQIGLAYFRAREYSTLFVVVSLLQLVLQVACNVYTVGVRKMGVPGVLTGNLLCVFAGWLFVGAVVVKECGLSFDGRKMKSIFKYSYPFLFTTILAVLLQNLDRITLRAYFSLREVGLYALACKFGGLMQDLILEPYNRSFGAYRFTIMRSENARELLVKIYSYLVTGLAFAGLGITLYSKEVLRLMTEPAYWAAYPLIPLLVLSSIVSGSGYTFQTGLLYEKKTTYLIPISVASAAVNVVLYLVLIPRFGMFGAVYAVVTKGIIETALTYFVSQRFYSIPYDHLRTAKAVGVTVSLVLLVELLPDSSIVFSLAAKTMLVLSSIALYRLVGCLSRQDLDRARGFLSTFGRRFLPVGG